MQFKEKEFTFTQPDGSEFKVLGFGDQHYARFETLDGLTVVQNPHTGFYEVAALSEDGDELVPTGVTAESAEAENLNLTRSIRVNAAAAKAKSFEAFNMMEGTRRCDERRQQRKIQTRFAFDAGVPHLAPPKRKTVGDYVGLCLLIDFSDSPATIPQSAVVDFCNKKGYSDFGNNGSVHDYFFENSLGLLRYTNIVTPYYRAKNPKSFYTDPDIEFGVRARQLIKEALDNLKAQGFDFSRLTVDSGGYVYALNIFYAGPNVNNWKKGLWAHAWSLASPYSIGSGRFLFDYQFTAMGHDLSLGTFCHENGHMLCDYPDLYDYGYESSGVGVYCLMCGGGSDEKNPAHISAYLKNLSGWTSKLTPITKNAQISLNAGKNEFAVFKKNDREYYIIENRRNKGRDSSLPGSGLAIWHVDENGNNSNEQMTAVSHYELSLKQADNRFDLEKLRYHDGDATDLYHLDQTGRFADDTAPNSKWWDGTSSNLNIREISKFGDTMTFKEGLIGENVFKSLKKESSPRLSIPDNNITGVSDTISFPEKATISTIKVNVDISHTYRGDLKVTLYAPTGDVIVLHDRKGGKDDDIKASFDSVNLPGLSLLLGKLVTGDWRLHIQDLAAQDKGVFNKWSLEFETVAEKTLVLEESSGTPIPDNNANGIEQTLSTNETGNVKSIEAAVEITHTYIEDLVVSLISPKGTKVDLHNKTGGSADNIFKTFSIVTTPDLSKFNDESVQGNWKLKVSDHAGQDIGKLNKWSLKIVY